MIKIYCYYSHGGYKNFAVEGIENELLDEDKEVTDETPFGFPDDAYPYFQYGRVKMIYKELKGGKLDLVVKEIPTIQTDGSGRAIPCAVQFIGDNSDRKTLDNMAVCIANDLEQFEKIFASLFYVREGLRIKGNDLRNFINDFSTDIHFSGTVPNVLSNVKYKQHGTLLFVPTTEKFLKDQIVTNNICNELNINVNDVRNNYISENELRKIQKSFTVDGEQKRESTLFALLHGFKQIHEDQMRKIKEGIVEFGKVAVEEVIEKKSELGEENAKLKTANTKLESDLKQEHEKNASLKNEIKIRDNEIKKKNKFLYILAGICGVLLISLIVYCVCSGSKQSEQQKQQPTETTQTTDSITKTK